MRLRNDLILRKIGGHYVVVDPGQEMVDMTTVFTLNETSAFLWKELHGKDVTVDVIINLLCYNYEVSSEVAHKDAETIFVAFRDNGLLMD